MTGATMNMTTSSVHRSIARDVGRCYRALGQRARASGRVLVYFEMFARWGGPMDFEAHTL